jgi:RNA polymerase sigma-70 factor (ECF subfamily)
VSDDETELMLRVAAGDEAAFDRLVRLVLPRLVGFFRRLGADPALAEDCAQETLVKVYRVREKYEPKARFITYLFHVARHHWIDVYRHLRAGPRLVLPETTTEEGRDRFAGPVAAGEEPGASLHRSELAAALGRAIGALPDDLREVFVLAQVDGLRYAEVGEILGIPVGTVKSRMFAAVRSVREVLRREGIEP